MKTPIFFPIDNFKEFRNKMLNWVQPFNIFCLLDNREYHFQSPAFECMLAVGSKRNIELEAGNAFTSLKQFTGNQHDWLFGHLGYDLKNETEQLSSMNDDEVGFPDCHFFVPEIVLQLTHTGLSIYCDENAAAIFNDINSHSPVIEQEPLPPVKINNRISHEDYLSVVGKLQQHILRGDCYEVNYCQEFYATGAEIDPLCVYSSLLNLSPNPFSALYR
ncbi:MAG: chorismate-binding protein, partial [Ferruginibacter sp.]